jgi:hypothetical protein
MAAAFSGFGANKAAKTQAKAANNAAATQARGAAQARADLIAGKNEGRAALGAQFEQAKALLTPLTQGSEMSRAAIMYENGLGPRPEGYEGVQSTPGFDFLQSEGRKSILNRAAQMGGVNSGAVLKELSRYQTNLDAQNYGAGYARLLDADNRSTQAVGALSDLRTNYGRDISNVALGHATQSAGTRLQESNAIANGILGAGNAKAQGTQALFDIPQADLNNSLQIASTGAEVLNAAGGVSSFAALSDRRDKSEIQPINVGLDLVEDLEPVTFVWDRRDGQNPTDEPVAGFIAQDLRDVQEQHDAKHLDLVDDSNEERIEARYQNLLPVMVSAIQELSAEVKTLKEAA